MNMLLPFDMEVPAPVRAAIDKLATQGDVEERGAVFTKSEVVDGILDLCGYVEKSNLMAMRLLEPSAGDGEFLLAGAARLLRSCRALHGLPSHHLEDLAPCIRAVELHRSTFNETFFRLVSLLVGEGLTQQQANTLAEEWFRQGDFLLTALDGGFDFAVGNPPYVRQERIPTPLLTEYKRRFNTLYDRADLYVLFYERCLDLLRPDGVLGFICANRWVKNKYGGPLREKIARGYNLDVYIDLSHANAFHEQVDAYPAITVIRRAPQSSTRVLTHGRNDDVPVGELFKALREPRATTQIPVVHQVGSGRDPWLVDAPEILEVIRDLEYLYPTLEEAKAKVGIGVATGADKIYIGAYDSLPVESERRLPLVMSGDLRPTGIEWSGRGVVNPWLPDGSLASLEDYPRFGEYMRKHAPDLKARHTAKKSPESWYKTIDRIYPGLSATPKLLIPDIKGEATVVLDAGRYYPHHNLYVVTSDTWDLRVLQAVLRSSVALAFIAAYSVRMSGGFLRFQAQYLRRIRVPSWETILPKVREKLAAVCISTEQAEVDEAVYAAYGLPSNQAQMITRFAASARVAKEKK